MTNLENLRFVPLAVSGNNYMSWARDVKMHLASMGLENTIAPDKNTTSQEKAKAMIFLCHHIDESLKWQYVTLESPLELWEKLKERYGHLQMTILPKARSAWHNLRLQDFKTVQDYNSEMFKITAQLRLCGEKITDDDMLEKTFSTFHASNVVLQQQYRERGFKKYSDLIHCLLVAEQNNELLLKNHESRPTGSAPFPEVNSNQAEKQMRDHGRYKNQNYHKRNQNRDRGKPESSRRNDYRNGPRFDKNRRNNDRRPNRPQQRPNSRNRYDEPCDRCGIKGHWARVCRTASHLAELYQASKRKEKAEAETNLAARDDTFDDVINENITHLDADDFIETN
ncbi:hypothetical protein OROGR_008573 [Orobanche gracilis]